VARVGEFKVMAEQLADVMTAVNEYPPSVVGGESESVLVT